MIYEEKQFVVIWWNIECHRYFYVQSYLHIRDLKFDIEVPVHVENTMSDIWANIVQYNTGIVYQIWYNTIS